MLGGLHARLCTAFLVCMITRLVILFLTLLGPVTDGRTDGQTDGHSMTSHVKKRAYVRL